MSKAAKTWILILAAGLLAGVLGIIEYGWQHPVDTVALQFGSSSHCRS